MAGDITHSQCHSYKDSMKAPESLPKIPLTTAASQVATKSFVVRHPRVDFFFPWHQRPKVP